MNSNQKKELIVPIVTPYVIRSDTNIWFTTDKDSLADAYISTEKLEHLKSTFFVKNQKCFDRILLAGTCGEGKNLPLQLWKQLIHTSLAMFKPEELVIGILYEDTETVSKAIDFIGHLAVDNLNNLLIGCPIEIKNKVDLLEFYSKISDFFSKFESLKLWLCFEFKNEWVTNEIIVEIVDIFNNKNVEVFGIKDARRTEQDERKNEIIFLKRELSEILVFAGCEVRFLELFEETDGGIFPLANLECKLMFDLVRGELKIPYIVKPIRKIMRILGWDDNLQKKIKETVFSRPAKPGYDFYDFTLAWNLFFRIYSEEPILNIHVTSFRSKEYLFSMVRTFLSDSLSIQTAYFKHNFFFELLFIPIVITFRDRKNEKNITFFFREPSKVSQFFQELFVNNYIIEHSVYEDDLFFNPETGYYQEVTQLLPYPQSFQHIKEEFLVQDYKFHYEAEDNTDSFDVSLKIAINHKLATQVPDFVFENLFRIAVFTKRNRFEQDKLLRHATRSAISQVMARNMSHNIGSHVLSKIITPEAIEHIGVPTAENKLFQHTPPAWVIMPDSSYEKIAVFNSYLRNRMDFLADIATGVPSMEVSNYIIGNLLKNFFRNGILLNRISGVNNFEYQIKVKDCRSCIKGCSGTNCVIDNNDIDKDILVSIPNDIYGSHALYIILENLIRNTAKHGGTLNRQVTFYLEVRTMEVSDFDTDEDLYEVIIYDDIKHNKNDLRLNEDNKSIKEILFKLEDEYPTWRENFLSNGNFKKVDWLVIEQNERLNESVLDPTNYILRQGAWGLIEMEVSAAYLRKIAPEDVDGDQNDLSLNPDKKTSLYNSFRYLNILKAVNKNDCLGYRFHLMKPKELIIIDEVGRFSIGQKERKILEDNGVLLIEKAEFDKRRDKVYPHPFCIVAVPDDFELEHSDYYLNPNLPTRLIVCQNNFVPKETNRHAVWIDDQHPLVAAIWEGRFKNISSFEECIVGLIWKVWLKNKLKYFQISQVRPPFSDFTGALNLPGSNYNIILSHHGSGIINQFENKDYVEAHSSQVLDVVKRILNRKEVNIDEMLFYDGIFSRALILDERIQGASQKFYSPENSDGSKGEPVLINQLLEKMNVLVPDSNRIDLNKTSYDSDYEQRIQEEILNAFENKDKVSGLDFVIIHLGVIEKTLQSAGMTKNKKEVRDFIHRIQGTVPDKKFRVIITSGRGKPDNLPEEIPYIGFSVLSQYCIENRFKSFLNQAIQAARPLN